MQNEQFSVLAEYNEWMNSRLYAVCAELPDHERKAERLAFFSSIHGTLNHLLLADRLWLGRFLDAPISITRLDIVLYEEFGKLREARVMEDSRIRDWADRLDASALNKQLVYTGIVEPKRHACTMRIAVTHFFNHQTHHRGQLTTLLTQLGLDYGMTDVIGMPGVLN